MLWRRALQPLAACRGLAFSIAHVLQLLRASCCSRWGQAVSLADDGGRPCCSRWGQALSLAPVLSRQWSFGVGLEPPPPPFMLTLNS